MVTVTVRDALPSDAPAIYSMIKELAEFENFPNGPEINAARLAKDLKEGAVHGAVVLKGDETVGMTLYYLAYSTWQGQFLHMEDLYVQPQFRRKGYGQLLWKHLGRIAHERGYKRLQWNVLEWNEPAIKFYEKLPAINLTKTEGWHNYRLDPAGIKTLAHIDSPE